MSPTLPRFYNPWFVIHPTHQKQYRRSETMVHMN